MSTLTQWALLGSHERAQAEKVQFEKEIIPIVDSSVVLHSPKFHRTIANTRH